MAALNYRSNTLGNMYDENLVSPEMMRLAKALEDFEASQSIANTGTGSRREGEHFEHLLGELWSSVEKMAQTVGASSTPLRGAGTKNYVVLAKNGRELVLPAHRSSLAGAKPNPASRWLDVTFSVDQMIDAYPGRQDAVNRYAPSGGPFSGSAYPDMFSGLKTKFDDTVLLVDRGVLIEKVLLEYKTAKSSQGRQIDGNAHERLSFQVMQYLEVATRYTKCSLVVISNGAFARYRNKYHINFHVQADRLANFAWFQMDHTSEAREYLTFVSRLLKWLKG
jgi:hypothetical protein